ncbi:ABC transporter permease [Corynebacterium freiburgense]|uniref:ABC transporter permease n=1 Tax=Corynebacterium freiburgense TaxID=556548 RepID=UPI0004163290|nr:FtsX-like permease family protein [Corynebacterium freiburgense]WJZ03909.1 ABC transporter permease YtrF precursor [Corynebacterium freiburgense]
MATMRTISVRTIVAHKVRLALTVLSVVLGTAFIAGSSMFTASLSSSFDDIVSTAFDDVDVVIAGGEKNPQGVPLEVIDQLRKRPDIKNVNVDITGAHIVLGGSDDRAIQTGGAPSQALSTFEGQTRNTSTEIIDGAMPSEADTIAVNKSAAERGKISVNDSVTVITPKERKEFKVVGIFDSADNAGGWVGVIFPEPDYLAHFSNGQSVDQAIIQLNDRDKADSIRETLAKEYPDLKVETASKLVEDVSKTIKSALSFVNYFLWAFAGIALLVGTFIISNTFSMIVAQRNREFALLRSIGISQSQITRSVIFEAILVGVIGSVLGIFGGVGLVQLLRTVMEAQGIGLPLEGFTLNTQSILIPLAVGIFITVLSAWAPARRAGSIRPVQAMRNQEPPSLLIRTIFGVVLVALGIAAVLLGALNSDLGTTSTRSIVVGCGAISLILGTWLAGPAISIPIVGTLGRIVGAPFRAVGRIASTNSRRNPRRTSATAFALTLGLAMVSSISMLGATMRENLSDMIDTTVKSDYVLTGPQSMALSIPREDIERVKGIQGVKEVTTIYDAPLTVNDLPLGAVAGGSFGRPSVPVVEGNLNKVVELKYKEGDGGKVALSEAIAKGLEVKVGDNVKIRDKEFRLDAIYESNVAVGSGYISYDIAREFLVDQEIQPKKVFIVTEDNVNQKQLRQEIEDAVAKSLVVSVQNKEEFAGENAAGINQMLGILYGLLALAVIIAVLGIVNTLALSVIERRQEIGMLRAVGVQRRQIRHMIYIESAVISVFGALIGAAIGLGLGWGFVKVLSSDGLENIVVPWAQVSIIVAASAIVGVLAAVWPAGRAARTQPLEAITD